MQYYPPTSGYPNSTPPFPYNNPYLPYNNYAVPTPSVQCPSPHVIGEGDVTAVPLPDGGVQLYFVPHRPPFSNPWASCPDAWFIRSIPIPFPTYQTNLFSQQAQGACSDQSLHHGEPENSCQVKFHNDGVTSTSDIHCFYPSLRAHNWFPKESVATQAEPPRPPEPAPCPKPCLCTNSTGSNASRTHKNRMEVDVTCHCGERKNDKQKGLHSNNSSSMSIEERNIIYSDKSKHNKGSKRSEKYKDVKCECGSKKYDKGCATVTEKATSVEVGRETQATCGPGVPIRRVASLLVNEAEVEFWYPKTPYSKKHLKSTESKASCDCGCAGASDSDLSQNN